MWLLRHWKAQTSIWPYLKTHLTLFMPSAFPLKSDCFYMHTNSALRTYTTQFCRRLSQAGIATSRGVTAQLTSISHTISFTLTRMTTGNTPAFFNSLNSDGGSTELRTFNDSHLRDSLLLRAHADDVRNTSLCTSKTTILKLHSWGM